MPRSTNGTYTKPDGTTAITGTPISSSAYNNLANDLGNTLTDSLSRSGKGGMQAALNMGGSKITNLGTATLASDATRFDQTQSVAFAGYNGGTSTGSAGAQAISTTPPSIAITPNRFWTFTSGFTNSGAVTLNINGLGARSIFKVGGALEAGDLVANTTAVVVSNADGSAFSLLNPRSDQFGTAASRNVGVASGNVVEVVDGSGGLNAGVNAPNKDLSNLFANGRARTIHASIAFTGSTGAVVGTFNSAGVTRDAIGLYTISFPALTGAYQALAVIDVPISATGFNVGVVSGTRTATSVRISTMEGNTGVAPFDPDRVTVTIHPIG